LGTGCFLDIFWQWNIFTCILQVIWQTDVRDGNRA